MSQAPHLCDEERVAQAAFPQVLSHDCQQLGRTTGVECSEGALRALIKIVFWMHMMLAAWRCWELAHKHADLNLLVLTASTVSVDEQRACSQHASAAG